MRCIDVMANANHIVSYSGISPITKVPCYGNSARFFNSVSSRCREIDRVRVAVISLVNTRIFTPESIVVNFLSSDSEPRRDSRCAEFVHIVSRVKRARRSNVYTS